MLYTNCSSHYQFAKIKVILRTPPWSPQEFLRLYHEQIAVEQKIDGASEENSGHRRRALHAIVAKAYRGNEKNIQLYQVKNCTV